MNFNILGRVCRFAAIGAILLGSASCIKINEELGESLIPTDQKWDVYTPAPVNLQDIRLQMADSLSAYSTSRFTFGSVNDAVLGTSIKSTSFTLVPVFDSLDFGKDPQVRQFHLTAVRDTLSTVYDNNLKMIQNIFVHELKKPLDSTVLYIGSLSNPEKLEEFVDLSKTVTAGIPVYSGGDSLSFDFSADFAKHVINEIDAAQKAAKMDSVDNYVKYLPGIYITTDAPVGPGGRINMFNLNMETSSGYITGNYAELKITST